MIHIKYRYLRIFMKIMTGVSSRCNGQRDGLRNCSKCVRTPVALLRSLSGKYSWERYETLILPAMG